MAITQKLSAYFTKLESKAKNCPTQVLVQSTTHGIDFTHGDPKQPFHIASVGKMMTAALVGILVDKGALTTHDNIAHHLDDSTLTGLFVHNGADHKDTVTISDLLQHTSGAADYFGGKVTSGKPFLKQLLANPNKIWEPQELLEFSRHSQRTHGPRGSYHYSDTGYILLGLIIEKALNMPYAEALKTHIFTPLEMHDSYLLFGGEPTNPRRPLGPTWLEKTEVSTKNLLSCDWAGGGIVSTLNDLLLFQKALWSGQLVSTEVLTEMQNFTHKFRPGMHYGAGLMELRFEGFLFILRGLPRPIGHSGVLGTLLFWDQKNDTHIVMNLGSTRRVVDSFKAIIAIEQTISRHV